MAATARPWPKPEYHNNVGPNDEGFWEWYEIEGVATFGEQEDAELAWKAVNLHDELVAALRPFAALGGPQDLTATPAYHDLEDDVVIYSNSGQHVTAGDVRAARSVLKKAEEHT